MLEVEEKGGVHWTSQTSQMWMVLVSIKYVDQDI